MSFHRGAGETLDVFVGDLLYDLHFVRQRMQARAQNDPQFRLEIILDPDTVHHRVQIVLGLERLGTFALAAGA